MIAYKQHLTAGLIDIINLNEGHFKKHALKFGSYSEVCKSIKSELRRMYDPECRRAMSRVYRSFASEVVGIYLSLLLKKMIDGVLIKVPSKSFVMGIFMIDPRDKVYLTAEETRKRILSAGGFVPIALCYLTPYLHRRLKKRVRIILKARDRKIVASRILNGREYQSFYEM